MSISHNVTQAYQIKNFIHENLITSKNSISNIANKILNFTPLITAMIPVAIVFSLSHPIEAVVMMDDQPPTSTPELDEVITAPLNNNNMICGLFSSMC